MDIYNYHPVTGEYLSTVPADPDPEDENRFLIPAHATDQEPPSFNEDQIVVFSGNSWSVVPDFRGTVHYAANGARHVISFIGDTVPAEHTTTEPPDANMTFASDTWSYDIEALRAIKLEELKAAAKEAFKTITATYPEDEQKSWSKQEAEAKAWTADNAAVTPFIDASIAWTGQSKLDRVTAILEKTTAFEAVSGQLVGKISQLRNQIQDPGAAAETVRDLVISLD